MKSLKVLGILLDFCHKKKIVYKTVMQETSFWEQEHLQFSQYNEYI